MRHITPMKWLLERIDTLPIIPTTPLSTPKKDPRTQCTTSTLILDQYKLAKLEEMNRKLLAEIQGTSLKNTT